jgi:hypothetical protein
MRTYKKLNDQIRKTPTDDRQYSLQRKKEILQQKKKRDKRRRTHSALEKLNGPNPYHVHPTDLAV